MIVRRMTKPEALAFFGDKKQHGILAIEGDVIAASCGFNADQGDFYVHSMFCNPDYPNALAGVIQLARRECKRHGFTSGTFAVDSINPEMLRLVDSGRARIETYYIRMEA